MNLIEDLALSTPCCGRQAEVAAEGVLATDIRHTGDPLCIIEVMKLFMTVHAEFAGTVREIGAENAQLVEYGQMLFVIEAD